VIEGSRLKVSIITSISKDHQEVLGDTLAQIAWEKVSSLSLSLSLVSKRIVRLTRPEAGRDHQEGHTRGHHGVAGPVSAARA
jgi:hypothetical protein